MLIISILNCGGEVCGLSKADPIERTHVQFCKHLLGGKIQTQNNSIYGELGRVPLRKHRLISVVLYLLKYDIVKKIYIKHIQHDVRRFTTFARKPTMGQVCEILLESLGFGHVWVAQGVGDCNLFMSIFKQRLRYNFIQGWNEQLENSSRANTYKLIADFNFKNNYIYFITVRSSAVY